MIINRYILAMLSFVPQLIHLRISTFMTAIGSKAECFIDTNSQSEGIHHVKSRAHPPGIVKGP